MNFNEYQIPKEYTNKFKVTQKDKSQFKKFWDNELKLLTETTDLSINDIEIIHNSIMDLFWEAKGMNKEKYTPAKYKNNIYINQN
ncbi:hypothetical protein PMY12_05975 [Clostridium tertium]|uniref:hypothetical protein n=1 Tax=Clostridium tertium TaxID=1559 RepID=UPI0023305C2F|nr:hypothetical protein [Clostridium tertium]MDB1933927.1 hypothetical protein [Clostridium tertium]MDB1936556.1 hypothetical protein [Clostridium tertium]